MYICINKSKKTMKKAFKVYKEGTTDEWVTIFIPESEFNQATLKSKIDKYISLGYQVQIF
jgi:hypothetical protein